MTAEALANLLHARRVGRGRWQAKCPAHPDRNPSLSIAEGRHGHILLRCWAGCETSAILAALGLHWRDICGSPMSLLAARNTAQERGAHEREQRVQRLLDRAARDGVRNLEWITDELSARLARTPDSDPAGDALTALFHSALAKLRAAESALEARR